MKVSTEPTLESRIGETLIGLGPLEEIIETAIFSAYLTEVIPLSLMLIGPSGIGKSKCIMQYRGNAGTHLTTDITSMGLQEIMAKDTEQQVRFIIIPDFNIVLSHRHATLQLTVANLLSITSEGSVRIDDGRQEKEVQHTPVGIISAMTREMYAMIGKKWVALGFSRRFLPLNYDYSLSTKEKINRAIADNLVTNLQLVLKNIKVPPRSANVNIDNESSQRIMNLSHELATNMGWTPIVNRKDVNKPKAINLGKHMEFSPHITLRTLARAHALRSNRNVVLDEDVTFCMKVISYTRYDQPAQL